MYLEPSLTKYMTLEATSFLTSSHLSSGTASFTSFFALSIPTDLGNSSSKCKPRAIALTLIWYFPISNADDWRNSRGKKVVIDRRIEDTNKRRQNMEHINWMKMWCTRNCRDKQQATQNKTESCTDIQQRFIKMKLWLEDNITTQLKLKKLSVLMLCLKGHL